MKRFDAYGALPAKLVTRHGLGGLLTVVSVVLMAILFVMEFRFYLQTQVRPRLVVEANPTGKIPVHFDITFPFSSCAITSVDILTKSGESMIDVEQNVTKTRLHHDGTPLTASEIAAVGAQLGSGTKAPQAPTECLSCFGAETPRRKCCNTCESVEQAYKDKGWRMERARIPQCQDTKRAELAHLTRNEGCRVVGDALLNRIGGNFHIAPGSSEQTFQGHRHFLQWTGQASVNLTHSWNELRFGANGKRFATTKTDAVGNTMFQYYVNLIPVTTAFVNGTRVHGFDYAVNDNTRRGSGEGEPGVFVYYDITPMTVVNEETSRGFLHFLIGVCAIVGGIFTAFQCIDSLVFDSIHTLRKKVELGKDV